MAYLYGLKSSYHDLEQDDARWAHERLEQASRSTVIGAAGRLRGQAVAEIAEQWRTATEYCFSPGSLNEKLKPRRRSHTYYQPTFEERTGQAEQKHVSCPTHRHTYHPLCGLCILRGPSKLTITQHDPKSCRRTLYMNCQ